MKEVHIGGKSNFLGALKTAQLVLKNRQNKNQRQKIIMFVGSPVETKTDEFVKLAKIFKKNNIAVDIINFGAENSENENTEKLEAFIKAVNNNDNSHFLAVPPGPHILSDLVLTSQIMMGDGGGSTSTTTGGSGTTGGGKASAAAPRPAAGGRGDFGVDPNEDPELALVLKMSYEEDRLKHSKQPDGKPATVKPASAATSATSATPAKPDGKSSASASVVTPAVAKTPTNPPAAPAKPTAATSTAPMEDDEQAELAKALAMSLVGEDVAMTPATSAVAVAAPDASASADTKSAASAAKSPATSSKSGASQSAAATSSGSSGAAAAAAESSSSSAAAGDAKDLAEALKDPEFLNSVLGGIEIPGIDKGQLQLDELLNQLQSGDDAAAAAAADKSKAEQAKKDDKDKDKGSGAGSGAAAKK